MLAENLLGPFVLAILAIWYIILGENQRSIMPRPERICVTILMDQPKKSGMLRCAAR